MKPKTPAVVLINPKYGHNVAAAIRACSCFGVEELVWTGERVNPGEYERLPREERMKGYKDVRWGREDRPFDLAWPCAAEPICVEIHPGATSLKHFHHPSHAVYVFGPEDGKVPAAIRRLCYQFIYIPSAHCLNLAAAINVVLYDRAIKREKEINPAMYEERGMIVVPSEILIPGWDGK